MYANIEVTPKTEKRWVTAPLLRGSGWPRKYPSPTRVMLPNLVVVGQSLRELSRIYAFQGHSRSS